MRTLLITAEAFEFIARAAANTEPEEFVGLLRKNAKGAVGTIVVVPLSEFGDGFSSINFSMLPLGSDTCGSVHSHPESVPLPSEQDLFFFSKIGGVHIITATPYDELRTRAYDHEGKRMRLKVVDG
jgi:proteasome lid subunit RPN8/RPN11